MHPWRLFATLDFLPPDAYKKHSHHAIDRQSSYFEREGVVFWFYVLFYFISFAMKAYIVTDNQIYRSD